MLSALTVLFTLFAAGFAGGAFFEASRQADIAQDTLIASSRPWLKLTGFEPVSFTSDDKDGVSLWVKVSVENVGHSPAQNVAISGSLLIDQFDPLPDQAMEDECRKARAGPFVRPGQVVFPDQTQDIGGTNPSQFHIPVGRVWAARAARIKSAYDAHRTHENPQRVQEWADALAQFPFSAGLYLVGCVNYRFADNRDLYQTNFKLVVGKKPGGAPFTLLGGKWPVDRSPEPAPDDPDAVQVSGHLSQRFVPGDQIKLGNLVWGTFAR